MRIGINVNPSTRGGRPASIDQLLEQLGDSARQGYASLLGSREEHQHTLQFLRSRVAHD